MTNNRSVESISAVGVLGEFSYDISFNENVHGPQVEVLYAENGRGKTNLLKTVDAILNFDHDRLGDIAYAPIASLVILLNTGEYLSMRKPDPFEPEVILEASVDGPQTPEGLFGRTSLVWQLTDADVGKPSRILERHNPGFSKLKKVIEGCAPPCEFISSNRIASNPDSLDKLISISLDSDDAAYERDPVEALFERAEKLIDRRTIQALSSGGGQDSPYAIAVASAIQYNDKTGASESILDLRAESSFLLDQAKPLAAYGMLQIDELAQISQGLMEIPRDGQEYRHLVPILRPYMESIRKDIDNLDEVYSLVDAFVKTVNSLIDRKIVTYEVSAGFNMRDRRGGTLDVAQLSSGERHLLYLILSALVANARPNTLLLVDEPELSLGLRWQRRLIQCFLDNSFLGRSRFILATHSLQVMSKVDHRRINRVLEESGEGPK